MKGIRSFIHSCSFALTVAGLASVPLSAQAAPATYTVDPTLSRLTLSGWFGGTFGWGQFTITNQLPGSMAVCWEGTIETDVQPDGSLVFTGGSLIRAQLNPNSDSQDPANPSFHPTGGDVGGPWSGADNYGSLSYLYDQYAFYNAYRDLVLDIMDGAANPEGVDAGTMTLGFVGGESDWYVAVLPPGVKNRTSNWPIKKASNESPRPVTVSADGSTLTIPVVLHTKSVDNGIVTIEEVWTGTIVAVSGTPEAPVQQPALALRAAGPAGLQFNTGAGSPVHNNGMTTAPWVKASWVGAATTDNPATYSFTIAKPPSPAARGFVTYLWLVPNPIGYSPEDYSGVANPNVLRLNLVSDGAGTVTATLAYKVNSPNDDSPFDGPGVICSIPHAPATGTWKLMATSDTAFTLVSPDGTEASGLMQAGDVQAFADGVHWYLGVNPNGVANLGESITVSEARIVIPAGGRANLVGTWDNGKRPKKDWTILARDPGSIVVLPPQTSYIATWRDLCPSGPGVGVLQASPTLGAAAAWNPIDGNPVLLANGNDLFFIPDSTTQEPTGFYHLLLP